MNIYGNSLVKGFLKTQGRDFFNGNGEKIALRGVGLGNWMLPEGYMWNFHSSRADRPRRIEAVIRELTGEEYSRKFWKEFAEEYITEYDIEAIAREGFNSIRMPINWRRLMKEGPGINFIEDGFKIIDNCLDLCEKYNIYVFLDLHGAPGGQTGANIDDSIDNKPRLFTDNDSYEKGVALWTELATRYKDRYIVGGYDLLNEPLHTPNDTDGSVDHLVGSLSKFYTDCIREIRKIDKKHLFSLEGHHWSTRLDIFDHIFDENMCIHFHRYWNAPDTALLSEYIKASKRLNVPLWLGETGENSNEWYTTMFFMLDQHNISWNFWTWKKMATVNSPYSINKPENYNLVTEYIRGGQHPGFESAQKIFDEYLHNMKTENCVYNKSVARQLLREKCCFVPAISYDTMPGVGKSFSGIFNGENITGYRKNDKMRFVLKPGRENEVSERGRDDNPWKGYNLLLSSGEWADYTVRTNKDTPISVSALIAPCSCNSSVEVFIDGKSTGTVDIRDGAGFYKQKLCEINSAESVSATVRIKAATGSVTVDTVYFD
ncbi:MAG: glycoside hydrolase family 5 protein [Oscillospiraceae bacterium]|nr:glycoside hydrolase family 5 protein [Oscillospiraceae bacterium]